jgi:hypothetical protein
MIDGGREEGGSVTKGGRKCDEGKKGSATKMVAERKCDEKKKGGRKCDEGRKEV